MVMRSAVLSFLVITAASLPGAVTAQQPATSPTPPPTGVIVGTVVDATNGLPIRASVSADRPRRTLRADSAGTFRIRDAVAGTVRLRALSFGYAPSDTAVAVPAGDTVHVRLALRPLPQSLAPVATVAKSPERARFEEQVTPSVVSISANEVRRVPAIGESDVLRSAAMLPGVIARNDFSAGFNVRGGEADQNLVLLDGIPIYNPFHLGGLFGTFIDKAVGSVDVMTGAFPTRYGGRLSSVLDVRSVEETRRGMHGGAEVSMLSSSAFAGGTVATGRLSWNLGMRRTYADKVIEWLRGENDVPYHFQDAQFRARLQLPSGGSVGLTSYAGKDLLYRIDEPESGDVVPEGPTGSEDDGTIAFDWGNRIVGLTLEQPLGGGMMLFQRLAYTRFSTGFELPDKDIFLGQSVDEVQAGGSVSRVGARHTMSGGYELARYATAYRERIDVITSDDDFGFSDPLATDGDTTMRQRPSMAALFVDDVWKPDDRWLVRMGLRGEYVSGASWVGASPRVSVKYFVSPTFALTAAGGRYTQWMRAMRNEDLPLRVFDLWVASDERIPVSTSNQITLGAERWLDATRFLRVEGYGKTYGRLAEPASTVDPRIRPSRLRYFDGHSYGVDVYLRQLERNGYSWWIAYSYGVTGRERGGERYWPAHDRRHNANIVTAYTPVKSKWAYGSRIGLASGTPYTGWAGTMSKYHYDPLDGAWAIDLAGDPSQEVRGPRNGERLPLYWRIDVSAERRYELGGASLKPYINVVNVLNHKNVFLYSIDSNFNPPQLKAASQFPFVPSFGIRMEW